MHNVGTFARTHLWVTLSFLKTYPCTGMFERLCPRNVSLGDRQIRTMVEDTITHLHGSMVEISMDLLVHPNNNIPHFPQTCVGSIDTFPIETNSAPHFYQPKYKKSVVKFQAVVSHLGLLAFLTGPHPGAMSDTTLAKQYPPPYAQHGLQRSFVLGDLAYISVPHVLPP